MFKIKFAPLLGDFVSVIPPVITPVPSARTARTVLVALAALVVAAITPIASWAQAYPTKPIKIVVPFAPGGGSDFIARFIAQRLQSGLGQPVIVDNRPGAGGNIGTEVGLQAPADGYTLTLIASSYTTNTAIYKLKYDPVNDVTPIVQLSQGPLILVANSAFAPKTTIELIALAKSKPEEVTFASAGTGSITHMAGELFASVAGIKLNHIPYKGSSPALTDTIGGQTNIFFATAPSTVAQLQSGKLKAIAVTTPKRVPILAEVPTISESGLPNFDVTIWHGLIGPKGMPKEVVARLNAEVNKILQLKETAEQLAKDGVSPAGGTPDAFKGTISNEISVWKKLVVERNIKPEQ
jgi:tripartite-type tricarboxylate transporter receptor subunit TctC